MKVDMHIITEQRINLNETTFHQHANEIVMQYNAHKYAKYL
ncbi:Uncharacterised protein [Yersinia kristensenii]|nr:hypothetical protein ykris0001_21550 [Yersinia kristensenii ATCC 33638]EEP93383.1 hypothetical protein ykris0001_35140 [Yersinia kristensenii ATCC 33638]SUP69605.1 Uncharacterised protein [Yersinia kristensenii]